MESLKKIVMLIDADNAQLNKLEDVIRELSAYGRIVVKRAYGNWRKDTLKKWESELKRLAIKAEQQFDYVTGKNTTDIALTIDAMDLLHTELYDSFIIVASDSDYTPLAIRLHESGVYVMGVGEKKTPEAFRNACDEFILTENISSGIPASDAAKEEPPVDVEHEVKHDNINEIHRLLKIACEKYQDSDGFVNISSAGTYIKRAKPDFDARTYGYVKLPDLIKAFPEKYEMKRYNGKGTVKIIAYRCKTPGSTQKKKQGTGGKKNKKKQ